MYLRCGLAGAPGTGKTYMVCMTLPEEAYPLFLIDVDNKANYMAVLQPLVKAGKVIVKAIDVSLVEDEPAQKAKMLAAPKFQQPLVKQPKGWLKILAAVEEGKALLKEGKVKTIVLDSLTRLYEHLHRFIPYMKRDGFMTLEGYGSSLKFMEEFIHDFLRIEGNTILTMHTAIEKDELTGRLGERPLIPGSMQDKVVSYFVEVYCMKPGVGTSGKTEYRVLTQSLDGKHVARTGMVLEMFEPASFKKILEKGGVNV